MNATKLIVAAGFAVVSTGTFAETGVVGYQPDHVANVYGRASAPNVQITGVDARQSGNVADSGSDAPKAGTRFAVTASKATVEFGRS